MRTVIDTSVIFSWFLPDESGAKYENVLNHLDTIKIHVPSIFEHEFMNILLNAEKNKRLDNATAIKILGIVGDYPITIEPSTAALMEKIRVFKMAREHELTAYDAAYLELAIRLEAPLITYDKQLFQAAKKFKLKTTL